MSETKSDNFLCTRHVTVRYCGSSSLRPRRGYVTTKFGELLAIQARAKPHKAAQDLAASIRKALHNRDRIALDEGRRAYAGIPAWWGLERWMTFDVPMAYDLYYERVRHLIGAHGTSRKSDLSKTTFLQIVAAHAVHADYRTGRNCRPSLDRIAEMTGHKRRTITRARTVMVALGLATEILRGRQRTLAERLASHRLGDSSQGWASVFALHQARPVDKTRRTPVDKTAGQAPAATHLVERPLGRISHLTNSALTPTGYAGTTKGHASRDPSLTKHPAKRPTPDQKGLALASRWRQNPKTPTWALRYSPAAWSHVLAKPAAHGWTDRDLNQLLRDYTAGHTPDGKRRWIADNPHKPITTLAMVLNWHGTDALEDRPAAADDARHTAHIRKQAAIAACTHCDEFGWELPYRLDAPDSKCAHGCG